MTKEKDRKFQVTKTFLSKYLCDRLYIEKYIRISDHYYIIEKYSAYQSCNANYRPTQEILF